MDDVVRALRPRSTRVATGSSERARLRALLLLAAAVAALILAARLWRSSPATAVRSADVAAKEWDAASNVTALAFYHEGVQSYRDASVDAAAIAFERATELDPTLAAAHLRLLFMNLALPQRPRAHGHFRDAFRYRNQLDEHDRDLLNAIEPWFRAPPDAAEVDHRLERLAEQSGSDNETLTLLCSFRDFIGEARSAQAACAQALTRHPDQPLTLLVQGSALLNLGEPALARQSLARCNASSPTPATCRRELAYLEANSGDCADAELNTRQMISLDTTSYAAHKLLMDLLAHRNASEAVSEALPRFIATGSGPDMEPLAQAWEAMWRGDFVRADERLAFADAAINAANQDAHRMTYWPRMQIALEAGEREHAAAIANDLLQHSPGWTRSSDDDIRIDALCTLRLAHMSSTKAWSTGLTSWLESAGGGSPKAKFSRWLRSRVCGAISPSDARAALTANPSPEQLLVAKQSSDAATAEALGRLYLLAGDVDSALPLLSRAAASCRYFTYPVEIMHGTLHLAEARALKGDRTGACDAYRAIVGRWGQARPRSVTVEAARVRARDLSCPGL
jgi:tetratricopeptide (TPR) repeat protein